MAKSKLFSIIRLCLVVIMTLEAVACGSGESTPAPQPTQAVVPPSAVPQPTTEPGPTTATEAAAPAAATGRPPAATAYEPLPAQCEWGQVVVPGRATITRAQPDLKPGVLFSTSGAFAEKPVDEPCDPGQELGPFPVNAGGSLVARLTGSPPAPNRWSLHNYGTGLHIVFEPLLGENNYGPGQEILAFTIPPEKTEAEMGGSWSGPGRLRAYVGAPHGSGPLSGSCFEQSYTAAAEIVEVSDSTPAQPGMTLHHGDSIVTEQTWGEVLIAGSTNWIAPGTEVEFDLLGPPNQIAGYPLDMGGIDAKILGKLYEFAEAGYPLPNNTDSGAYSLITLEGAYRRIQEMKDPCEAAVDLKLVLDAGQSKLTANRAADLLVDVAGIWLLPNNWDVLDGWGKWIFGQLPGVSYVSKAQNALDTWERVKKEWIPTLAEQKSQWTLDAYERYKENGWSEAQIVEQQGNLQQQSEEKLEEIKTLREEFEAEVQKRNAAIETEIAEIKRASEARLKEIDQEIAQKVQAGELILLEASRRANEELSTFSTIKAKYAWHELQMQGLANEYERQVTARLTEIARLQTEIDALETYAKPLARNDCPGIKPPPAAPVPDPCTGQKLIEMGLKKGTVHVIKQKLGPAGEAFAQTITVNLDKIKHWIWPDGTEYSVEKGDETAIVRVYEGQVTITSEDGPALTVAAGQQVTLPDGKVSALVPEPVRRVGGIPLAELRLDSDMPEPYEVSEMRAEDGTLPSDWLWQEPNRDLNDPGDATLEVIDAETLRITVPNENEFWGYRADAPRLLHKVTGDFDLEAEMLLESQGTHFAISEFLIFTPDTPLGYLKGQMNTSGLGDHYFIAGGGWAHWQNENKLSVLHREWTDAADAPDGPVQVKLSRRGDQLKTHWSTDGGQTWTLSNRHVMAMPETLWVGWLFKRMALDGLNDEPAVITLRDIHLTTAPLGSVPESDWDVVGHEGTVIPLDTEILMAQDGSEGSYVQAYSPWSIAGDFDLTVRFEAPPIEMQPEQERYIHVAVTSNDEKNHAYVRNAMTPDWHRYDADMAINAGWYRYRYEDTQESSGRLRLVRKDGVFSGFLWKDGDWLPLADWQEGFSDPVYLDFRYQWKTPTPALQAVRFSIEWLETEAGVLIGADEGQQTAVVPVTPTAQPAPAPALTGGQRLEANALFDDFSSPALDWSVRDNETSTTGYEADGYAILVKQPTYWVMSKVPGDFPHTVIEFDAVATTGSAGGMYGVTCHYQDSENYDFVAIDPETGSISAGRLLAGEFQSLSGDPNGATEQPAKGLATSVTASNHIRVGCYDDRLELAVGGTTEGTWPLDPPGTPGSAALFVYGFQVLGENGYKTLFDNLAAWHDETPPATPISSQPAPATTCTQAVDPQIAIQWDRETLGCPTAPATTIWAAVQAFERGLMIWREDLPLIYTFDGAGGWAVWPDVWSEGVEMPSRGQPPAGLQAPVRGFGFVWATEEQVFQDLGWARWEESGMCAILQTFEKGLIIRRSEVDTCAGQTNPGASAWFGSVEAYDDGGWR